jgi:peptide/nickel transport system permease protein
LSQLELRRPAPGPDASAQSPGAAPPRVALLPAGESSYLAVVWRRLLRDRAAMLGAVLVAVIVLGALLAPLLSPHDPAEQFRDGLTLKGEPVPSTLLTGGGLRFPLGTDANGRDLLSRILFGARISLLVGVLANLMAVALGAAVGSVAGFFGGWVEMVLMRLTDTMMAFPTLLLAMTLVAILKPSVWIIIVVIGAVYWTWIARVVYGQVVALRERDFITATQALGASRSYTLLRHVIPQLVPTLIVWGTLGTATNVMLEASLSYLGIGVQPPTPSWGGMIQQAQSFYRSAPWLVLFPGLAIMLTVFAFNLLGDGLRDALDPTQRGKL